METQFKQIPGWPNYSICKNGYVKNQNTGKILKNYFNRYYDIVCLSKDGKRSPIAIHLLMAITYLNHVPNGHKIVIDHINNDPRDNRLENLQLISHRHNVSKDRNRKLPTGVYSSGKRYSSKLQINGKIVCLGTFDTPKEAHQAYLNALN